MSTPQIVLRQEQKSITLQQCSEQVILKESIPQIVIHGGPIVANILPFSAIATVNGQTVFQIYDANGNPLIFSQVICFFIMGTGQDIITGDFSFSGNVFTLGSSAPAINAGDVIFGSGMV